MVEGMANSDLTQVTLGVYPPERTAPVALYKLQNQMKSKQAK